jgi:hypothetical protein
LPQAERGKIYYVFEDLGTSYMTDFKNMIKGQYSITDGTFDSIFILKNIGDIQ